MRVPDNRTIAIAGPEPRTITVEQFARNLATEHISARKYKRVLCAAIRELCAPQTLPPPREIIIIANGEYSRWQVRLTPTSAKWDKLEAK